MTEKLDCQGDKVTNGGEKEDRENVFNISCLHDQKLKNKLTETGEMAQRLRVHTALAKDGVWLPASISDDSQYTVTSAPERSNISRLFSTFAHSVVREV